MIDISSPFDISMMV
jgi:hypothetical protein